MAAERVTMDGLLEEQQAALEVTQAEELKAERDRWAEALEASERQITHLTDKAAALEKSGGPWPLAGGLVEGIDLRARSHESHEKGTASDCQDDPGHAAA